MTADPAVDARQEHEEGDVTTVTSDQGIGGTLRVKVDAVFHVPYADPTTVGDLHFRFQMGGLSATATVRLKHDNGSWGAWTTAPVTMPEREI